MDWNQEARRVDSLLSAVGSDMRVLKPVRDFDPAIGSAADCACVLNGPAAETALGIELAAMPGDMPDAGVVEIDAEWVLYLRRTGLGIDSLARGFAGTEASAHADQSGVRVLFSAWQGRGVVAKTTSSPSSEGRGVDKSKTVFLSPLGWETAPEIGDTVALDRILGKIVSLEAVGPDAQAVLYKAEVAP